MLVKKIEKGVFVTTQIVFTEIMLQKVWSESLITKCFTLTISNYFWFWFLKIYFESRYY